MQNYIITCVITVPVLHYSTGSWFLFFFRLFFPFITWFNTQTSFAFNVRFGMSIREHKYSTKLNFLMKVEKYRPAVVKYPYLTSMGYYGAHTDWKSCLHLCSSLKSSNISIQVAQHMKAHCTIMWKNASTDLSWRGIQTTHKKKIWTKFALTDRKYDLLLCSSTKIKQSSNVVGVTFWLNCTKHS